MNARSVFCSAALLLLLSLALAVPAGAEEGNRQVSSQRLEEMVVIGSRARIASRADELPAPVEVYPETDFERVGEVDLGAALSKLVPSFNYSRTSVGDGGSLNPATLRGLSPDQTLVLVNGKRRHSMAWLRILDGVVGWGSGGTDLRAVPAAAIARAESYRQNAGDVASWSCGLPHVNDFRAFAVGPDGSPLEGVVAACGFQGYPGYSPTNARLSDDDRASQAAYGEVEFEPLGTLAVTAAVRFENYSDAGGNTTGKLAARLPINDVLALRGAASTGFRAPSLSQRRFNSILFVGSETGLTTVFSANQGHAVARAFGVDSLDHETSTNLSGGIVFSNGNFDLAVDAYSTDIDDRIVRSLGIDCAGIAACDTANVGTAPPAVLVVEHTCNHVSARPRGALKARTRCAASRADKVEAAAWLVDHGADPDLRHDWGGEGHGVAAVAMHLAAQHGAVGCLEVLLDHGADPTIVDGAHDGTPLGWAEYSQATDPVALFRRRLG